MEAKGAKPEEWKDGAPIDVDKFGTLIATVRGLRRITGPAVAMSRMGALLLNTKMMVAGMHALQLSAGGR